MSDVIYKGQSYTLELPSQLTDDLTVATKKQILYRKPNGTEGAWEAGLLGQSLIKEVSGAENDDWGTWRMQTYLELGGKPLFGKMVDLLIHDSIKPSSPAPVTAPVETSQTITGGSATTINDGVTHVYVNPPSVLAAHVVTMPANPYDQQRIYFFFGALVAYGQLVVTDFSIIPNTGQLIYGNVSNLPFVGGAGPVLEYDSANTMWRRIL